MPEDTSPQHIQQQMCAFFRLKLGFIVSTLHWVRLPAQPRHQGRFGFKPDAHWSPGGSVPSVFGGNWGMAGDQGASSTTCRYA